MIPLKLTIEGLYSYRERQEIDFENLGNAGLFGIFGATGSGKSSILEAISFVLYGRTERLNSRDKAGYNMMNLKANRIYLEFEFLNHEEKVFRVVREFKRNSKRFGEVKPTIAIFYEKKNDSWIPLEHDSAETLIGLNYENFKRTIIIPQGQFKEFLELGASERTKMMSDIFGLSKFDLAANCVELMGKTLSELDHLQGKLSGFEEISEERIQQLNIEKEQAEKQQLALGKTYTEADKAMQVFVSQLDLYHAYTANQQELTKLAAQLPDWEQKEKSLKIFEETFKNFGQLLTQEQKVNEDLRLLKEKETSNQKKLKDTSVLSLKQQELVQQLQKAFDNLEANKHKVQDLATILLLKQLHQTVQDTAGKLARGDQYIKDEEAKASKLKTQQQVQEQELEHLKKQEIDPALLLSLSDWYQQKASLQKQIEQQQLQLSGIDNKIKAIDQGLKQIGLDDEEAKLQLNHQIKIAEAELPKLETIRTQQLIAQKISEYSHALHDGEACPLCGSLEHPKKQHKQDEPLHQAANEQYEALNKQLEQLKNRLNQYQQLEASRMPYVEQRTKDFERLKDYQQQLDQHLQQFSWAGYNPEDTQLFEAKKQESQQLKQTIQNSEEKLKETRKQIDENEKTLRKYEIRIQNLALEHSGKQAKFDTLIKGLKQVRFADYQDQDAQVIQTAKEKLESDNQLVAEQYQQSTNQLQQIEKQKAELQSVVELLLQQIDEKQNELNKLTDEMIAKLSQNGFEDKAAMLSIFNQKIDVEQERQSIQQFRLNYTALRDKVKEQEEKLNGFVPNEEQFRLAKEKLEILKQDYEVAKTAHINLSSEWTRLRALFEQKKELLLNLDQLQKRKSNLSVLRNLFNAQGFVAYVSSIYLEQLCHQANVRFHRMTRNQLSLQIGANLDFEIVDYLNEGRVRSVKTLSGGQAFQVALSLALALAESVQSNALAHRNFFFIDEGFGTQDAESVNVVFETLLQLHKENKIVGIISHVDELKERIPRSLTVVNDPIRGSLVN